MSKTFDDQRVARIFPLESVTRSEPISLAKLVSRIDLADLNAF